MTAFVLRMAWRETRGGWRHFVAFLGCVVLGVGALVGVGTFAVNLERALAREAKSLMGGDLEVRSARPLEGAGEAALGRLVGEGAVATRVRELVGMARSPAGGGTQLVELKAVDARYPLYGRVETTPAGPLDELLAGTGVLVEERLLSRLGLAVGDRLLIGNGTLTIRGLIRSEPDRPASLVSLGPRVLIGEGALAATGLVRLGSRVRYRALLRLPESMAPAGARAALAGELADPGFRVAAFDEGQGSLRRFFAQLTTYLGLVGLASLLIGGLGVASSVTTFIARQAPTIAILKCLGADSRVVLATYLVQIQGLGMLASLVGALLGVFLQPALVRLLGGVVPFALEARADPWTIVRGLAVGTLATLLVMLWPLLRVRAIRPSRVLRRQVEAPPEARRPWLATAPIALGLGALVVWQAGSWKLGGIFVGAALAALLTLFGVARGLVWLLGALPPLSGPALRHGVTSLRRPGGHTARVIVALGVGVMLLVVVAVLEASLGRQIDHEQRREAPSFFFVDVQPDQRDAFSRTVAATNGGMPPTLTRVVRSRLIAIQGTPLTRELVERRSPAGAEGAWYFTREYVLTDAAEPPATSAVTRGRWWTEAEAAARPRISVEEEAARHLGVDLGSTLTFNVQGVPIEAEVMSLRKVDWQSFTTNFFVIFSPGALDGAPATYVATARVAAAAEAGLQDRVVAAFPNVTAVPVRDVLDRVAGILGEIALAMRLIALFSIGSGVVVMAGALAATRSQRLYESVILRTLGATRGVVARAFAVEYACLGAVAGLAGTALAMVLAWIVLRFVLEVPWTFEADTLGWGVGLTVLTALAVGFLGTFRLLGRKPLAVLRQE